MTNIKFFKRDGGFFKIICDGHTGFGVEGEDIVCAALSSIVQTAVLGVLQIAAVNAEFKRDEERGYLELTLPENITERQRHDANVILSTLYLGAADLYSGYSDFIELEVL
ncbi:MAG: ribosomal-processing cysteine protease Prp [Clostridiales bacterium]|nr:ribosomal-processing cysteine protease Prp [Clostridiales bacterium]